MSTRPSRPAALVRRGITVYQAVRGGRPTSCRFYPSCSAYADEALVAHGLWRGGRLALRRVLRCHPFGAHGVDPVPPAHGTIR